MAIEVDDTVDKVRKSLDEEVFISDLAVYPEDFNRPIQSDFSDDDLRGRVLDGARYISARVSSNRQTDNVRELSSSVSGEIDLSGDKILDDPRGDNLKPFIRLLENRVEVGGNEAERRTLKGNLKLESTSSRAATSSNPAYVYSDFEFIVEQGSASNEAKADVVELVFPTDGSGSDATYDGVSYTWNENGQSAVPLPETLQEALIEYVVSSCMISLGYPDMSQLAKNKMLRELAPYSLPGVLQLETE